MKKHFIYPLLILGIFTLFSSCKKEIPVRTESSAPVVTRDLAMEYYKKGRQHFLKFTRKDVLSAIEYFEKAIKIKPDFALAMAANSEAYAYYAFHIERNGMSADRHFQKAKQLARQALQINPQSAEAHRALGWYYFAYGVYPKALQNARQAAAINPQDPECAFLIWAAGSAEELDSPELKKALKAGYIIALMNAGSLARRKKLFDEAIQYFQSVIKLVPNHAHAYVNIGNVYLLKKEPEKALEFYKKALDLYHDDSYIYFNYAAAYVVLKDYRKAEEFYKKAVALNKSFYKAHLMLMKLYKFELNNPQLFAFHRNEAAKIKREQQITQMNRIREAGIN